MKQITPLLHAWSEYLPLERLDRSGYFAQGAPGEPGALIDPVPFQTGDREQLAELGGVAAVVLTGGDKAAAGAAAAVRRDLGCEVHAPEGRPGPWRVTAWRTCAGTPTGSPCPAG